MATFGRYINSDNSDRGERNIFRAQKTNLTRFLSFGRTGTATTTNQDFMIKICMLRSVEFQVIYDDDETLSLIHI